MKKNVIWKRMMSVVLTLAMCFAFVPPAMAEEGDDQSVDTQFQIDKSKTASLTVLDREDPVTEITLAMPSGEYKNAVDIVFVMDNSTSVANAGFDFSKNAGELFEKIVSENDGIDLKVGVVKFRGYATDMLGDGLETYSDETRNEIVEAIANNTVPGSGSNLHSGMVMAEELLAADTEVEDSHKYVVLLTDCKSYIWNNEENEPTTYYAQYAQRGSLKNSGKPMLNQWAPMYNKESGELYTTLPQITDHTPFNMLQNLGTWSAAGTENTSDYYQCLYDVENDEIAATDTKYDAPCYYTKYWPEGSYSGTLAVGDGTAVTRALTNGAEIFTSQPIYRSFYEYTPEPGTFWEDVNYLELAPYEVVQNDEDGTYSYDTTAVNEDFWLWHPSNMEKGIYQAGHYWKEVLGKYNTAAIATYKAADGTGSHLCGSFRTWLFENSDSGADVMDADAVLQLFTDIDNSIRYAVGSGVVTDQITDPFDLEMESYGDDPKVPFKMVVGQDDSEDRVEYIAVPVEGKDNEWTFGEEITPGSGDFPYTLTWDNEKNTFQWFINVPVENAKPVHLSYRLRWKESLPFTGRYEPTNAATTLEYKNSQGEEQAPEEFESPEVLVPLRVFYDANGGTGTVTDAADYTSGASVTLKANSFTRSGYTFSGWSTDPNGSADYQPGAAFTLTEDTTFYAIWSKRSRPPEGDDDEIPDEPVPMDLDGEDHFAYIEGYPDGTVQPEGNITRAEVSTMIYRLLKEERRAEIFTDQNDYSDVEKPNWFNKAVSSMTVGKYVNGYPDGSFLPNQAITRAEFVTIVVRFLDGAKESENPFSDIDGHWAKDCILSAVKAGWIDGYPDGTFQPNKAITRAEAMKIMNTILHRGVNETSELGEPVMFPDNSDAGQWYYYEVIEATNDHETEGERPDEQWKSNTIDYTYDIEKYERP